MGIPRIYCEHALQPDAVITLPSSSSHHLLRVLRLKPYAELTVFNGIGKEYAAMLVNIENGCAIVKVKSIIEKIVESPLMVHLAQALVRNEKMDLIIQKAVELGVNKITPVLTENNAIKLSRNRVQKKSKHWQSIIINACEQSGRLIVPELTSIVKFSDLLAQKNGLCCVLHNHAKKTLMNVADHPQSIILAIGPEGGFSEREVEMAHQKNWQVIKLGPRTLRTETAGLTAISAVQMLWGDLR